MFVGYMTKKMIGMYNLRMKDGDLVTKHMNSFNTMVIQLLFVDTKNSNEDK